MPITRQRGRARRAWLRRSGAVVAPASSPAPRPAREPPPNEGCRREMAAFDAFPAPVRHMLAHAAFDVRAAELHRDIAHILLSLPGEVIADFLVQNLAQVEERTLARANWEFWVNHGRDLPHVAAGATILR